MQKIYRFIALMLTTALVACGGGGGSAGGDSTGSKTPAVNIASIEVLASAAELRSADSLGIKITAVVKDTANKALTNQAVAFKASSGTLSEAGAATGTDGKATAMLTAGADRSNRSITVTVTSGGVSGNIVVPVTGTTLSITGTTSLIKGGSASYSVSLKDSSSNPIEGVTVSVTSTLGNALSPASSKTDSTGTANFAYAATNSGSDSLVFSAAGASQTLAVSVSSQDFTFSTPATGAEIAVNQSQTVTVRLLSGGVGVAGKNIYFGTTRGLVTPALVTTDAAGNASVVISSASAGRATISAQIEGGTTATLPLSFVASIPSTLVLQASGAALPPNEGASVANQVELRAMVRDAAGNPVKGRTVFFTAVQDLSGGTIKTGSAVTDANGLAKDAFVAGAVSTAANGVVIRATVANTAVMHETRLTVSKQALFIAIASNNTLEKLATTYRKTFSVQVNDANGAPVADQNITLSYWAPKYMKGTMVFALTALGTGSWKIDESTVNECQNEDVNRNGILDSGEDQNSDARLNPGLPAVIAPASVTTSSTGFAEFTVTYGQQYALWFEMDLTARAMVAGTESSGSYLLTAPVLAADVTDRAIAPAGRVSPFGTGVCTSPN